MLTLTLLLAGCPKPADEGPHCEDTKTAIAFDEVTAIDLTANDVLAGVPTSETSTFLYADDGEAALTVGFTPGTEAFFVDSEEVYPEGGVQIDIAVICDDYIAIDGTFAFATDDGVFNESLPTTLSATFERVSLWMELADATGTFDAAAWTTSVGYDELSTWIDVAYVDGASLGSVQVQASGEDECDGDTCSAWSESTEVGVWPITE